MEPDENEGQTPLNVAEPMKQQNLSSSAGGNTIWYSHFGR